METIGARIKQLRNNKKFTQQQIADYVGVSKTSVIYWEKDETIPKHESLLLLAKKLEVTTDYIMYGQSLSRSQDMVQSQSGQTNDDPQLFTQIDKNFKMANIRFSKPDGSRPTVKIPVYRDVKAACGNGFDNFLEDPSDYIEMDPLVLKMLGIESKSENLKIIYSVEDSMFPTVPHDKPLFIDVSDRDPSAIKTGRIYVFTHAYSCRMKRIFIGFGENGEKKNIRLASDNPDKNAFPDEWITREQLNEINFIGRLVWTGKEL